MGSNNNKNQQSTGYGPNPSQSGSDPRGQTQNAGQYAQQRYESQQGPLADAMSYNYGRGSEADFGNYNDIMQGYRDIAATGGGGGGYSGGGYSPLSAHLVHPGTANAERVTAEQMGPIERTNYVASNPLERVTPTNPYASYGGFQDMSKTGGYSPQDMANLRARGTAPVRAAYGNAQRAVQQQRSLQGGYAPNAIAAQAKMAREQGQSMSDAMQGVEGGIVADRNAGMRAGLTGMSNIEGNQQQAALDAAKFNSEQGRLGNQYDITNQMTVAQNNADAANKARAFDVSNNLAAGTTNASNFLDAGKFNTQLDYTGQVYNADAMTSMDARNAAASQAASSAANAWNQNQTGNRLAALGGMQNLYGTTPGMSQMFGNQAMGIVGQGGNQSIAQQGMNQNGLQLPGQYDQTMGRVTDALNLAGIGSNIAYPWMNRNQPTTNNGVGGPQYGPPSSLATPGPTQMSNNNPGSILANYPQYQPSQPPPPNFNNYYGGYQ